MTLGYLVPEFPGQTHIMFWRELGVLRAAGVEVDVISTRPPRQPGTHEWVAEAAAATTYLVPVKAGTVVDALSALVRAGPGRLRAWAGAIRSAEGFGVRGGFRLVALGLLGAALAGAARRRRWTHLHVHSCADAANLALFAATLVDLTYSLTLHGPLGDYGGNQRQKWGKASFAIVITEILRREVETSLAGALPPSVRVVGMGIDGSAMARTGPYEPWRPGGHASLFTCARLNLAKGHVHVIAAVIALRSAGVDAELVIAGEDEQGGAGYRLDLERHIADAGVGDGVHLLGSVPEAAVRAELERAHVFVLASHAEPLGVAVMEAMAMEVPVVVTSGGGVSELVDDGDTGLLVPPAAPEAIAAAVRRLLDEPTLATGMGQRARTRVLDGFGVERNAGVLRQEVERLGPPLPPASCATPGPPLRARRRYAGRWPGWRWPRGRGH